MYDAELLETAVTALAAKCDGASTEDGAGFNKVDSFFGKSMAAKPSYDWTANQSRALWRMIEKYKKQLLNYGVDYSAIPEPPLTRKSPVQKHMVVKRDRIIVTFDYDPHMVSSIKELPKFSRKYDPSTKVWTIIPTTDNVEKIADFASHYEFEVGNGVYDLLAKVTEQSKELLEGSRAAGSDFVIEGLGGELYPFQRAGVEYAVAAERCFIADQMGLGKTVEALATIWVKKAFPAIVVCPASVKYNWALETLKWLPDIKVGMVQSKQFYRVHRLGDGRAYLEKDRHNLPGAYDIIIINYDLLKPRPHTWECHTGYVNNKGKEYKIGDIIIEPISGWNKDAKTLAKQHFEPDGYGESKNGIIEKFLKIKPQALIMDESHFCKNFKSQRAKGVTQLSKGIEMRLALSGTPLLNRPSELISQLTILGRLEDMGGFWGFAERYCAAHRGRFGMDMSGSQNLEELNNMMRRICYIRRTKPQVLPELPPKQRSDVMLDLDNRKEYNEARDDLVKWLKENAKLESDFLESIANESEDDQKILTSDYRVTAEAKAARALQLVRIEHLKQLAAKGKMVMAIKWIENFLEGDQKLVVFATHIDIQKMLIEKFTGSAHILGEDSSEKRQQNIEKFQKDENCQLIVCSLKAGGVGITLTAASDVVFLELGWTPADHSQAEDRCHRIGQEDNVMAWYLLANDSIDMDITELINEKRVVVDAATEGGGSVPEQMSIMNDLIKRLMK